MNMNIHAVLADVQRTLAEGNLTPELARNSLVKLTALQGSAATYLTQCEIAYKHVLRAELMTTKAANKARITAECSPAYVDYRQAKDVHESIKQLIVTCRGYLRSLDSEMQLTR